MTVCIIPARGGSKRIPRKNVINFCGDPLIYWTIKQAKQSRVDKVYVSTDDPEIKAITMELGASVIERPPNLSGDNITSDAVWSHTVKTITEQVDVIVGLQCTSPLRFPEDIDDSISMLHNDKLDSVVSVCLEDDLFLWDSLGRQVTFSKIDRKLKGKFYRENGSIYVFKRQVIESPDSGYTRYGQKTGFFVMQDWQGFEIDTPEDVTICEYFMRKKVLSGEK